MTKNRNLTRRDVIQAAAVLGAAASIPGIAVASEGSSSPSAYDDMLVIDALCFGRNWDDEAFAALRAANYSGIVESLPRRDLQTAIDALVEWQQRAEAHSDAVLIAREAADFRRAQQSGRTAVLMNFQDTTMFEGELANVDALYALGMRSCQLTYNARNLVGDGCLERTNAGLSDFGVALVDRLNEVGVMIDLSHCGPQTTLEGIEFSKGPVAITHTMCDAVRPGHPRAKSDELIRRCAEKGGVIGMIALGYFVGPDPGGETGIEDYADHIEHAVNVAGIESVGISTDFPPQGISPWATYDEWYVPRTRSFKPSYELRWPPWIPELDGPDRYRKLMTVLEGRGWKSRDIERLYGLNWMRLFGDIIG
ncbi:MAG: membrane dipeptidase [Halieaceae bacterium]|jgi:membrane dipeptidase|nr:membrane dipeptidase [Halieaceae bacterium]